MTAKADLLASHATRALELARAAGLDDELPDLEADGPALPGARRRTAAVARCRASRGVLPAGRRARASRGTERAEIRRDATSLGWRSGGMT